MSENSTSNKLRNLDSILKNLTSFVIGFSGGLDSAFLIYRVLKLKKNKFIAVTVRTAFIPNREINEASEFAQTYNFRHSIIDVSFPDEIRNNPSERCYLCKKILFGKIVGFAKKTGYKYILDGTNADDLNDYRPGLKALDELNIRSPLAEAGLTKSEIRQVAHDSGLTIWDKPAMTCLLTRIPYDSEINEEKLKMIEKAEDYLFEKGFPGTRVRIHGDIARIECISGYITRLINDPERESIVAYLKNIGFRYVSLDLEGYRKGSMNKNISEK